MFDTNDPRLTAYVLDELDDASRVELEAEMERSPELRRAVDEVRRAAEFLREMLQNEPAPTLTSEQRATIRAASREAQETRHQPAVSQDGVSSSLPPISEKVVMNVPQNSSHVGSWLIAIGVAAALVVGVASLAGWGIIAGDRDASVAKNLELSRPQATEKARLNAVADQSADVNTWEESAEAPQSGVPSWLPAESGAAAPAGDFHYEAERPAPTDLALSDDAVRRGRLEENPSEYGFGAGSAPPASNRSDNFSNQLGGVAGRRGSAPQADSSPLFRAAGGAEEGAPAKQSRASGGFAPADTSGAAHPFAQNPQSGITQPALPPRPGVAAAGLAGQPADELGLETFAPSEADAAAEIAPGVADPASMAPPAATPPINAPALKSTPAPASEPEPAPANPATPAPSASLPLGPQTRAFSDGERPLREAPKTPSIHLSGESPPLPDSQPAVTEEPAPVEQQREIREPAGLSARTAGGSSEGREKAQQAQASAGEGLAAAQQSGALARESDRTTTFDRQSARENARKGAELDDKLADDQEKDDAENEDLAKKKESEKKTLDKNVRTWRRARAVPNASRLMIGDNDELPLQGMQANVTIDGFRARVLLDLYFYNDRGQQLEGDFKLRLPGEASLYYFAFGESSFEYRPMVDQLASRNFLAPELIRASGTGPDEILRARGDTWTKVKEARIVPREKAAHAYSETVRRRVDPALVEWSGAGVFNARVFPLMPGKLHRIVVGYDVNLTQDGDALTYSLDLPEDLSEAHVDLNVAAVPGAEAEITPAARPFLASGRAYYHLEGPWNEPLRVRIHNPGTIVLHGKDSSGSRFFATRLTPKLPAEEAGAGSSHALFLVDTSLSSNPDKFNVWLELLETTLTKNRDTMQHFAVLFFNIESHWWREKYVENNAENVRELLNHCQTLALEGATDLRQALAEATSPSWPESEKPASQPDLFLLSDGAATWGEQNLHLLAQTLRSGTGGTLFAYQTGLTGTAVGVLEHLARESGGAVFSVAHEQEVEKAAVAHRQRPWRLVDVTIPGGSDLLTAGRPKSIYPDQTLLIVGRGEPDHEAVLRVARGEDEETLRIPLGEAVASETAARLYGQVAVGQLEDLGAAVEDVAVAYARHFRVTGQTCSLLMLESEADYQRFNIRPEDDAFVVKSSAAGHVVANKLDELGDQLTDPKQALALWLAKMENVPGVQFRLSTAMKLALQRLPAEAVAVQPPRLVAKERSREDLPKKFFQQLQAAQLDYDAVAEESARRKEALGAADALKALSSLVENNPGDVTLARDVAFSAMEWGLGGQAYALLRRVADARPYEPQVYQALAQCAAEAGNADLAIVYYEVALGGQWHERYQDFHRTAGVEYVHLLRRIDGGKLSSHMPDYAKARLESIVEKFDVKQADLVVTMMWNTDRTDIDLHVLEPSGEECYYKNRNTRAGGEITRDVTEGYGPEMYVMKNAPHGKYVVRANYYGSDANRTGVRTKVYVTVYEDFGGRKERVLKKTVPLSRGKELRDVAEIFVEKE